MKRILAILLTVSVLVMLWVPQPTAAVSDFTDYFYEFSDGFDRGFHWFFYPVTACYTDLLEGLMHQFVYGIRMMTSEFGWLSAVVDSIFEMGESFSDAFRSVGFVTRLMVIDGISMEPTLHHKDRVIVSGLCYQPDNGDIIVFEPRGDSDNYYIKRVIATEGQSVDIQEGEVYVDGVKLEEEYISAKITSEYSGQYPKTVPEDCVFVLGDNRNVSRDSRDEIGVGMVEEKSIVGKALFRVMPLSQFGSVYENYNLK